MNEITTAIAIMDEKGRRNAGGNSIMLWEKDWNLLRSLLVKTQGQADRAIIERLSELGPEPAADGRGQ